MENLPVVDVLQGQRELHKPVEYLLLSEVFASLFTDPLVQVSPVAVVHHNVEATPVWDCEGGGEGGEGGRGRKLTGYYR